MRCRRAATAATAILLASTVAFGNGRPPLTNGIHFRPGDQHSLYVATTFGLLISHDDGCTFDWLCENNVGYGGMFDPIYAVATDGTIFATTYTGLRVSRDGGCTFQTATDDLPPGDPGRLDVWVNALAIGPTGEVWIGTADATKPTDLYRSIDNGATFTALGMQAPTILWNGIQVAPSDAMRIYATGNEVGSSGGDAGQVPGVAHFFVSANDGAAWTPLPLTGVKYGGMPSVRVVAVDPANPDIVYLASELGASPPNGDLLYRSADGGMTLAQVLATSDPIHDVAIDGQRIFVTTSIDGGMQTGPSYESTDGGMTFGPTAGTPVLGCIGRREDGVLVGCGANWDPDFMAVAKSPDDGSTWQKVWRFAQLDGPLKCPAGTVQHDTCDVMRWPTLQQQFGATGPVCGDHQWPGDPAPPSHSGGGCCDAGGGGPASLLSAFGVALWLGRRRRRDVV